MAFAELTTTQVSTLWDKVHTTLVPNTNTPEEFAQQVLSGKLPVFDIIMACVNCSGEEWDAILSALMDKPVYKCAPGETAFPITDYRGKEISSPRGHRYGQTLEENKEPRPTQTRRSTPRKRGPQSDPRVIMTVKDNPKTPGSKAHARYALYQVGMTVDEFLKAGGRRPDINYDLNHGFITVGFDNKKD